MTDPPGKVAKFYVKRGVFYQTISFYDTPNILALCYCREIFGRFALLHIIKVIYDCSYARESFRLKAYGET